MTGDERNTPVVLQPRDLRLLEHLSVLRIVDRKQASALAPFHSKTRANARLLALTRAGILKRVLVGTIAGGRRAVYTRADKTTATRRGGFKSTATTLGLLHQLAVNDVYIAAHRAEAPGVSWRAFERPLDPAVPLIPDGYLEMDSGNERMAFFVEVDRGTEPLGTWRVKANRYLTLATSGLFETLFRLPRFGVVVVAPSDRRVAGIRLAAAAETERLFFLATHSTIKRDGFWSPIWLRPIGDERQPLLRKERPP